MFVGHLSKGKGIITQTSHIYFFFFKVSLIQTTEQEALPPPELQLRIADILSASPDIAETVSLLCSSINLLKKQ